MKKLLAMLLSVMMTLSLVACGAGEERADGEKIYKLTFAGSMPTDAPASAAMERIKEYIVKKNPEAVCRSSCFPQTS